MSSSLKEKLELSREKAEALEKKLIRVNFATAIVWIILVAVLTVLFVVTGDKTISYFLLVLFFCSLPFSLGYIIPHGLYYLPLTLAHLLFFTLVITILLVTLAKSLLGQ